MAKLPITFTCALPESDLLFGSMTALQGVSMLDEIELNLYSPKPDLLAEDLLGKPALVTAALSEGPQRHFGGIVMRFGIGAPQGRMHGYQASLRPWLWFLTRSTDCRIFQNQSVPDIVDAVFGRYSGIARHKWALSRSYRQRVYCVQYRETDYNFVARLLEEEGIYWSFEHTEQGPELVLVDEVSALSPIVVNAVGGSGVEGGSTLPFYGNQGQVPPGVEHISAWSSSREVQTGKVALTSYDFERPSADLGVDAALARSHTLADLEQFDFQGEFTQRADGQQLAENRIDEVAARHERLSGSTNAQALCAGGLFTLARHPRDDQNTTYLCLQARTTAQVQARESGDTAGDWQCSFSAMPASQIFRPPRRTPKPFVQGPQTAVVVGPAGDEIYTDKYSRVKVQFHWDRYGQKSETSSCWLRVSSPWAGKSFGFVHVPRIGQEVVVDFLEGDPDQPLVTGRVYNAEQMPPWDLPANMTQSGVLTRSSKGGAYGNANALRFEDKKGSEQLWLHAEKDQLTEVENDEDKWVGHDRRKTVDHDETTHVKHDRTETVGNNETITIGVNRTEQVGNNETIAIGVNRTETVGANENIAIGANRSITVGASETATVALQRTHMVGVNETIAIGAAQEIAIGAAQVVAVGAAQTITVGVSQSTSVGVNQSTDVGANQSTDVGANQSTKVGASRSIRVGADQSSEIGKNRNAKVGDSDSLKIGKNLVIDAGDSVTIKTGSASITLKKDGTIQIKGKNISIDGSGKINVKASSDVVIKGSKVLQN